VKLSHFQLLAADSITYKPGDLMASYVKYVL
jgi:hypothetical protein